MLHDETLYLNHGTLLDHVQVDWLVVDLNQFVCEWDCSWNVLRGSFCICFCFFFFMFKQDCSARRKLSLPIITLIVEPIITIS